ncbi:zinc-ribbon domain-containing protein [bacterium]|nr:zinc-ribbon domain-containing protein [bacterium]
MFVLIGTSDLKKNLGQEPQSCMRCEKETIHRIEQVWSWLTFFFIPIIPLGKKKIMKRCNLCGQELELDYRSAITDPNSKSISAQAVQKNIENKLKGKRRSSLFFAWLLASIAGFFAIGISGAYFDKSTDMEGSGAIVGFIIVVFFPFLFSYILFKKARKYKEQIGRENKQP